jgi:hypothetical protein
MKLLNLHPDTLYPANLRDMDGQLLSSGAARIDKVQANGIFAPQDADILRTLQASTAIIEIPQLDLELSAYNLTPCKSQPHFHFDLTQ